MQGCKAILSSQNLLSHKVWLVCVLCFRRYASVSGDMPLFDGNPKNQILPGRKKLNTTLDVKAKEVKEVMTEKFKEIQSNGGILYGDVDMGSKK